jgi:hypothetical protein
VQKFLPIQRQHREVLDQWLEKRRTRAGPIFLTRSGKRLDRTETFVMRQDHEEQPHSRVDDRTPAEQEHQPMHEGHVSRGGR